MKIPYLEPLKLQGINHYYKINPKEEENTYQ